MGNSSEEEFDNYINDRLDEEEHKLVLLIPVAKRAKPNVENSLLDHYTDEEFREKYRFRKEIVLSVLLPLVNNDLERATGRGHPVPPIYQLLAALRFYATGSATTVKKELSNLSQPSISRIVKKLSHLLSLQAKQFIKFPTDIEPINKCQNIEHIPNIVGAIDTTHIAIPNPGGHNAKEYINTKKTFSIKTQIVSGPDLTIYNITTHPGSATEHHLFDNTVRKMFEEDKLDGAVIGDKKYTSDKYLIIPQRSKSEDIKALTVTHNTVIKTIHLWREMFPCLSEKLATNLTTTCHVIIATAVLYNIYDKYEGNVSDINNFNESDNF